jgi:hypothetical protein
MSTIENVHTKDKYYVMLLEDGLVTVPKQWLTDNKKYTFWPSNVNQEQRINLIKSCAEVNEGWDKYKIQIIYGVAANYKRAREKEKLAEKISDVNTTSDEEENKRKRKIRSKKILTDTESKDDAPVVAKLPRKNKICTSTIDISITAIFIRSICIQCNKNGSYRKKYIRF